MAAKNITKQILHFLKNKGVGYYADISPLIQQAFPIDVADHSDAIYNTRVREYLDNLEKSGYIKCKNVAITLKAVQVEAAILDAGITFIKPEEKSRLYKFVEFLFWLTSIGRFIFGVYIYFHPPVETEKAKVIVPAVISDSSKAKSHQAPR